MSDLKLKVTANLAICQNSDIPYVYSGLGLMSLYTFRITDYYLLDSGIIADMFFGYGEEGVARADRCLKEMEELGIVWRPYGDRYYAIGPDSFEDSPGDRFVWVRLDDFLKIRKEFKGLAPEMLRIYIYMLSTRCEETGWVAGRLSQEQLAEGLGIPLRTFNRYEARLREAELIYVKARSKDAAGKRQTNIYGDFRDRERIDRLDPGSLPTAPINFMRGVSHRYNSFINGKKLSARELKRLKDDCIRYNECVRRGHPERMKDLSVFGYEPSVEEDDDDGYNQYLESIITTSTPYEEDEDIFE